MTLAVNQRSAEVEALAKPWPMLQALQDGTAAMRAAGKAYLPQWPAEEDAAYRARLATATLFPAYRRTVGVMSGKPFSKALALNDADKRIVKWAQNIDLQGVNLHTWAAEQFRASIGFGLAGVLVEYPRAATAGPRTVAAVERAGLRPYWVRVRHDQVLGWRVANVNGAMQLTQLRLWECVEEDDGPWGTQTVEQVRVLYPGGWQTYRATGEKGEWVLFDEGRTTLSRIPFVPFYGQREAFMVGRAPMIDLAYLNVKHWQSQSDQDTILHAARVPILAIIGADDKSQLTVGASTAVKLPLTADMKWVEHGGAAIGAGETSLDKLRDQMIQTGAELLVKRESGDVSATEAGNDAEANKSDLQRIAEGFEDALDMALEFTAEYAHLDKAGTVSLFSDYGAATLSDASASLVLQLQQGGLLSKETALAEFKRRGVLAAEVDVEDEIERAEAEGPALGELSLAVSGETARAAAAEEKA